jgi:predicted aconitase with swiveling domain
MDEKKITIKGRKLVGGRVKGEAIVSSDSVSFWGGVDNYTGVINEAGHNIQGQSVAEKILVCPSGKGSSGGSMRLYDMSLRAKAPLAIVNRLADEVTVVGAIVSNIPMVDSFETDPLEIINTGDIVDVDGDAGTVTVYPKEGGGK